MKKIILLVIVAITILGSVLFYKNYKNSGEKEIVLNEPVPAVDGIIPGEVKRVDENINTYTHKQYGFSFNYPSNMTVSNFREGEGEQILFQGDNGDWFQIYINPWDEEGNISVKRIEEDLPDIVIQDPQVAIIGPRQGEGIGPEALIFFSKDQSLGETREAWFVYKNNLYQFTTYKRLDSMIGRVLSTLVFSE